MADSKISLKLLIDKNHQRLLFAEAGKDFIDFLFSLMVLPVGTVLGILGKREATGGLSKLYGSVSDLKVDYLTAMITIKNPYDLKSIVNANGGGFVKGPVTYMVMDDLVVSPMPTSTFSSINLFNKLNINDLASVEERVVRVGTNESSVLEFVHACYQCE
ncbi:uncharacterized protein LOC143586398 [Bidens hawaiensis]|uniref:uncharacterized protein LOC143586398 n=1 Tax=Bidens hawaiensis TaxID=980011 RepID=UPI00404AA059